MQFKNKVVLVTGACQNTGLGIAKKFIEEGALVYVNGPTIEETNAGEKKLKDFGLTNFVAITADISVIKEVESMFSTIMAGSGKIDILINNASDQGIGTKFEELTPEEFSRIININLLGTFQVSSIAVKMMLSQPDKGIIVNLGSNVSQRAIHNRTAYISSKGGIEALSRSMAIDLGPKGIRVNCVAPGYINTDRWSKLDDATIKRRRQNIPLGEEAMIADIADAVIFLASANARNICGERLVVDGGCSAQHMPQDIDL